MEGSETWIKVIEKTLYPRNVTTLDECNFASGDT